MGATGKFRSAHRRGLLFVCEKGYADATLTETFGPLTPVAEEQIVLLTPVVRRQSESFRPSCKGRPFLILSSGVCDDATRRWRPICSADRLNVCKAFLRTAYGMRQRSGQAPRSHGR